MNIALVEDEPVLLEKLKLLIDGEGVCRVVGAFDSAESALKGLEKAAPEVMLIDINLPGMSGIELTRRIKQLKPGIEIIAFTGMEDRETILSVIRAGASGYILKGSTPREMLESIQTLCRGGAPVSPRIARLLIEELQAGYFEKEELLSRREKDILKQVEAGLSYKEIADKCFISSHTVHTHIKNIHEKLGAEGRQQAVAMAKRKGLI